MFNTCDYENSLATVIEATQTLTPPSHTTSDCVMAELEKLGSKYKVALRIARDSRFERLPCQHKGT